MNLFSAFVLTYAVATLGVYAFAFVATWRDLRNKK